ncbi:hypothetical protein F2P56_005910 [Juglans regia]|uniref:Mitotic checkpoint serine/threonine-protein kinase BUB1 n=2 Tax=Juglans regia TaxID=51240 RepID=A0A834CXR6_JUGRE|nr:uncharacterized protein LOC109010212 [Juglans regia]KAF5473964.1 hypothetical protein F2P56_005910 [Juglans regia]
MEKKQKITQYRERLDKTLALPDLANKETLETLVKNQLLHSSEDETNGCNQKVIENRTAEVSFFLDMLRSASVDDNDGLEASERSRAEWKLKQDKEDFRVMYREGPKGTPFHTLLVEGYVDGPVDVCLCTSWESSLYKKWWPQFSVPTFKMICGKCLQKVRIGEQISLVRMKVPWPLSTREAIVHYFMFEYFQDDLIVVLLNTISDLESIDISTHGFTNEVIPEANGVVRIDVVGGFALQKVTSERSYFRTIANMDIKLDFVPPSLINFISRQLIGNGFRLYQKVVSSMSKTDKDFIDALGDPLYTKIREALYSPNISERTVEGEKIKTDACIFPEEHLIANKQDELVDIRQEVHCDYHASESEPKNAVVTDRKAFGEIEEEESEENKHFEEDGKDTDHISTKESNEGCNVNGKRNISIRSEVEQALGTLEKVISVIREYGFNAQTGFSSGLTSKEPPYMEVLTKDSNFNDEVILEVLEKEIIDGTSLERPRNSSSNHSFRHARSNSLPREVNHNKILLASTEQEQYLSVPNEATQVTPNGTTEVQALDQSAHDIKQKTSTEANGIQESSLNGEEKSSGQKKHRLCCFMLRG